MGPGPRSWNDYPSSHPGPAGINPSPEGDETSLWKTGWFMQTYLVMQMSISFTPSSSSNPSLEK